MKDFSDYRKNYTKYSLLEDELVKDPFDLFKIWLKMAEDDDKIDEPNAFTLSTVNKKNEPRIINQLSYYQINLQTRINTNFLFPQQFKKQKT